MVPRVGQKIGPYEILGPLGTGGMGLVFSAWDSRLHRDVAIKLLRDEFSTAEMRARFLQEARAASALNHPNICTIFDIGEYQGDPYLVMELLKGRTLRSRILEGPLPFDEMLQVATEIAEALTAAHARGVIHRDIKPANIILVEKPAGRFVTKVLDFGLAKVDLPDGLNAALDYTNAGSTVGTVAYMSPEQARGEVLDARSDLFALGTVCYEMATGEVPFRGATSAMVFVQILNHPPESARQVNPEIPREFDRVLRKMLEKDRSQRYQSAAELVAALETVRRKVKPSRSFWRGLLSASTPAPIPAPTPRAEGYAEEDSSGVPVPPSATPPRPVDPDTFLRPVRRIVSSERPLHRSEASRQPIALESAKVPAMQAETATFADGASAARAAEAEGVAPAQGVLEFRESRAGDAAAGVIEDSAVAPLELDAAGESASGDVAEVLPGPSAVAEDAEDEAASKSRRIAEIDAELRSAFGDTAEPPHSQQEGPGPRGPIYLATAAALVMVLSGGLLGWRYWAHHRAAAVAPPQMLLVGAITNNSGDDMLGPVLVAGLELDLVQSPRIGVLGSEALGAGLRVVGSSTLTTPSDDEAQRAAQAVGAGLLLTGETKLAGSGYQITLRVVDTATGAQKLTLSATASSREQLPGTIDVLAADVRSGLGEAGDSVAKSSVPLARNATSNLEALAAYERAESLRDSGQFLLAMQTFDAATKADPHFAAANIALAELFRRQRAEVEAAAAAQRALEGSANASPRTKALAQAADDIYHTGDLPHAEAGLRALLPVNPQDTEVITQLSSCLRLEGKFQESLEMAQRLLSRNPYALDAASNAEYSLIALDRTEAAAQMEAQIQRSGRSHPGLRLLMNLINPHDAGPQGVDITGAMGRLAPQQYEAMTLDAGGLLDGGLAAWRAVAAQAAANPELASAAGNTLAQAALDRALVNECAAAHPLIADSQSYAQGPTSIFSSGLASALCGDLEFAGRSATLLETEYKQNWAVNSYLLPDLHAAILWKQHAADARKPLEDAHPYDRVSVTPYLRGLIHLDEHQPQAAIVDFQGVLEHRGSTTLANPVLYAMAQLGLARAYAAGGDSANAAEAYRRFLNLWGAADPELPMLREAHAGIS